MRIVSATNRDLLDRVEGRCSARTCSIVSTCFPIEAFRRCAMRREDIPHLLRHFLARFCAEENRPITGISGEAVAQLSQLDWPGNIRQLENTIYRAVVMCDADQLGVADFPQAAIQSQTAATADQAPGEPLVIDPGFSSAAPAIVSGNEIPIHRYPRPAAPSLMLTPSGEIRPLEELEGEIIRFAISHYRGQMSEVARRLKIGRSTLYRKIERPPKMWPMTERRLRAAPECGDLVSEKR